MEGQFSGLNWSLSSSLLPHCSFWGRGWTPCRAGEKPPCCLPVGLLWGLLPAAPNSPSCSFCFQAPLLSQVYQDGVGRRLTRFEILILGCWSIATIHPEQMPLSPSLSPVGYSAYLSSAWRGLCFRGETTAGKKRIPELGSRPSFAV